MYNLQISSQLN